MKHADEAKVYKEERKDKMKRSKSLLCLFLVLVMMFSLFACSKDDTSSNTTSDNSNAGSSGNSGDSGSSGSSGNQGSGQAAQSGSKEWVSITVGAGSYLGEFQAGLNPGENWAACDAVFDTVFRIDPVTKQIFSVILKNWYWEDDTTLIMEMRDDVYFSNGDNATAEDLIFSYWNHIERGSNYLNNFGMVWDQTIPRDTYTAQFKVEKPYPLFVNTTIYLYDKAWSLSLDGGWDSMEWYSPVGSGPYKCVEYLNDSHMVLQSRGDDYWYKEAGPIYVDEWVIRYIPDASAVYMALETGDLNMTYVDSNDYLRYAQSGSNDFTVVSMPTGAVAYWIFSMHPEDECDFWLDKRVREAVAIGMPWEELGIISQGDLYIKPLSIAPQASPDFINPGQYEYNLDRARELMIEAGYGPDNMLKVKTSSMTSGQKLHEAGIYYLSQIYIDATVDLLDFAACLAAMINPGNTDYGLGWFAVGGNPRFEVRGAVPACADEGGVTYNYIPFPEFLEKFEILMRSTDPAEITAAGKWVQQYMFDEILYIPVWEVTSCVGWTEGVLTQDQVLNYRTTQNGYQLSRLGMASAWN